MPGGGVFRCIWGEHFGHVCGMPRGGVLERERCKRVCVMPGGGVLERNGRKQRGYVCAMPGGGVFKRVWSDEREYVCLMPGGGVLDSDRSQRVYYMRGEQLFL
jgi:hypothetical protein